MVVLDSNIFIYLANGMLSGSCIEKVDVAYSIISQIETLGFHGIMASEQELIEDLLNESIMLPLTPVIASKAVYLRKIYKMGLGDSIVAATALEYDVELWTANVNDFKLLQGLKNT